MNKESTNPPSSKVLLHIYPPAYTINSRCSVFFRGEVSKPVRYWTHLSASAVHLPVDFFSTRGSGRAEVNPKGTAIHSLESHVGRRVAGLREGDGVRGLRHSRGSCNAAIAVGTTVTC